MTSPDVPFSLCTSLHTCKEVKLCLCVCVRVCVLMENPSSLPLCHRTKWTRDGLKRAYDVKVTHTSWKRFRTGVFLSSALQDGGGGLSHLCPCGRVGIYMSLGSHLRYHPCMKLTCRTNTPENSAVQVRTLIVS